MAVSFLCAFPSLAFARVPCRVSPLLRILGGEQRRAASGVVAVLGLWLWSWSTSRCLWPFVCVRGVVPPLRGSSPLPTLGVVRAFAPGFSPSPACFRAPQKGALDFRAPRPQADAGVARGWVALACAGKAQVRASEGCSSQASEDLGRRCLASLLLVVLVPHSSLGGGSARLSARVSHLSAARDGARRGLGVGWGGRGTAD